MTHLFCLEVLELFNLGAHAVVVLGRLDDGGLVPRDLLRQLVKGGTDLGLAAAEQKRPMRALGSAHTWPRNVEGPWHFCVPLLHSNLFLQRGHLARVGLRAAHSLLVPHPKHEARLRLCVSC
jgi:hypothetical protein